MKWIQNFYPGGEGGGGGGGLNIGQSTPLDTSLPSPISFLHFHLSFLKYALLFLTEAPHKQTPYIFLSSIKAAKELTKNHIW